MADALVDQLRRTCNGTVTPAAALAPLTTMKVGGPARVLVQASSADDLAAVGAACADHGVPWLVVDRGSNLLVADGGFPGVAITLGRAFRGISVEGTVVRAGAAELLPVTAVRCAASALHGLAFGAAIPGSVGGAVRMNAGAHGREISDVLAAAEVVYLEDGRTRTLEASELGLRYRHSSLPRDAVVVAARFVLEPGDAAAERAEIGAVKSWRRAHQPINSPSCGSVFTNPPDDSAGRLVDAVGAKGWRVGGAAVSQVHANFIVTQPGARASDVRELVERLHAEVARRTGVTLVPEVVMVGFDDGAPLGAVGASSAGGGDDHG